MVQWAKDREAEYANKDIQYWKQDLDDKIN